MPDGRDRPRRARLRRGDGDAGRRVPRDRPHRPPARCGQRRHPPPRGRRRRCRRRQGGGAGRRPRPPRRRTASTGATPSSSTRSATAGRWSPPRRRRPLRPRRPGTPAGRATATSGTCRSRCRTSAGPRRSTAPSSGGSSPRPRWTRPGGSSTPAPTTGVVGGSERGDTVLCWRVDDVAVAVERVRQGRWDGDRARDQALRHGLRLRRRPGHGLLPVAADRGRRRRHRRRRRPTTGPPTASRHGDVAYLTIGVVDSARFRAFFGSVLGWRFTPGQVVDGWNIEGTMPMAGLHGGQDRAGVEPMYRVDDIHAAVESVRRAGGTPGEVERHPYGLMCPLHRRPGHRLLPRSADRTAAWARSATRSCRSGSSSRR